MRDCTSIQETHYQTPCDSMVPTYSDVVSFFSKYEECKVSIVYLNRYGDGVSVQKVRVTDIDDECRLFFSQREKYYFCYPNLLTNLLAWSKHPRCLGLQGYIGNHISVGEKENGELDVHETIYKTFKSREGNHSVLYKKTHIKYKTGNELEPSVCGGRDLANVLWNDIKCHKSKEMKGGRVQRLFKTRKGVREKATDAQILETFQRRYERIAKDIAHDIVAFVRIPYAEEKRFEKLIKPIVGMCASSVHIITDAVSQTSLVAVNLDAECC